MANICRFQPIRRISIRFHSILSRRRRATRILSAEFARTRWNALAMVLRAGKNTNVGGHIASFASSATLYEAGFNHFWRAPSETHGGDLIYFQGHSSPGVYARAFLTGRLSEAQLDRF